MSGALKNNFIYKYLPISGLGFGLFSTTKIGFGTYCGGGLKIE